MICSVSLLAVDSDSWWVLFSDSRQFMRYVDENLEIYMLFDQDLNQTCKVMVFQDL